ncbi:ABC transporter ATP-binding protein [Bifidobacterium dentium]|uniref:ABC transporter, ATP-binding protein n=1 Tax=Bifidobacterium dentium JCVIHMP022 TaxID=553191 RepID=A0AB72Z1E0_9BIFI|nr:dipeptide/oligopeptide/nickel ABC transporter ATP-binding protein [Bifidobacterium dentium]EFO77971.1 ABC transporter, ATP-binding protein [Bifidobacterium dentium JCVIHMP022]
MSQVMSDHTQADPHAPIIELKDAEVVFTTRAGSGLFHKNRITAVNKVNLKLMPGQTIGIVGESGCGKSTTANIMCGLQQVTSGKVFFKGQDVTHRTAKERMAIGRVVSVVFQDPATALNARMSVIDQLIDPLVVHKLGDRKARLNRAEELIHMVGLPSQVLGALPGQLSGGQRQRVASTRTAIIADEPTSALDVSVRAQILNLLSDLKKTLGLSMVFISHDIQTVRYISDQVVVMNKGTIVERGATISVMRDPQDDYTKILMGAAPSLLHPTAAECA